MRTLERFMTHVLPPDENGCMIWTGKPSQKGYGGFTWIEQGQRRITTAHRWIYIERHGQIDDDQVVRHTCDVPLCMADAHHQVGTQTQNIADMVRRDRQARGSALPQSKLSEPDIAVIRSAHAAGDSQADLARRYGVHPSQISRAVRGVTWKHAA